MYAIWLFAQLLLQRRSVISFQSVDVVLLADARKPNLPVEGQRFAELAQPVMALPQGETVQVALEAITNPFRENCEGIVKGVLTLAVSIDTRISQQQKTLR